MNRYERKNNGMNIERRKYLKAGIGDGMIYKSVDDFFAHLDYHNVVYCRSLNEQRRKYWQRYVNANIWKRCQKRHANKRIRGMFDNAQLDTEVALPQNSQYKKIHELIIH